MGRDSASGRAGRSPEARAGPRSPPPGFRDPLPDLREELTESISLERLDPLELLGGLDQEGLLGGQDSHHAAVGRVDEPGPPRQWHGRSPR